MKLNEWIAFLGPYADDYAVSFFASLSFFLAGFFFRFLVELWRAAIRAIKRIRGVDEFSEVYGKWYYYRRRPGGKLVEIEVLVKPALLYPRPNVHFDTGRALSPEIVPGVVGRHGSSYFFLLDRSRAKQSVSAQHFPFLIVFGNRPREIEPNLGFVVGKSIVGGELYSGMILLSKNRIGEEKLQGILQPSQSVDYQKLDKLWNIPEVSGHR
jgi:hypothetical protein